MYNYFEAREKIEKEREKKRTFYLTQKPLVSVRIIPSTLRLPCNFRMAENNVTLLPEW